MTEIKFLKLENGKRPISDWLVSLDRSVQARILDRFERMEEGNYGDFKIIDNEIKELRFKFGSGYRIYFYEENNMVVLLLCGGDK